MSSELRPHPDVVSGLRQAAVPLVPIAKPDPAGVPIEVEPIAKRPEPDCSAGGPHRYPPQTRTPRCKVCGVSPEESVKAHFRAQAEAKLREAFA